MEPNFPRCHVGLIAYVEKGSLEEAVADPEKWRKVDDTPWIWSWQAYVYGRAGQEERARRLLKKLQQLKGKREMDPAAILFAHIGMGDREQSFAWLENAYSQHSSGLTTLKVEPIYDPLRGDPRFQELLRRVRLAE
jgi:Flp pilus assembly protein TadD